MSPCLILIVSFIPLTAVQSSWPWMRMGVYHYHIWATLSVNPKVLGCNCVLLGLLISSLFCQGHVVVAFMFRCMSLGVPNGQFPQAYTVNTLLFSCGSDCISLFCCKLQFFFLLVRLWKVRLLSLRAIKANNMIKHIFQRVIGIVCRWLAVPTYEKHDAGSFTDLIFSLICSLDFACFMFSTF